MHKSVTEHNLHILVTAPFCGDIVLVTWRTTVLVSESPSSKCTKLHTVAASNNRDHMPWSRYYCLFAPHIYGCCSSRTSRSLCMCIAH